MHLFHTQSLLIQWGGNQVESIEVPQGATASLPITAKEGHTFQGWFTGDGPNDIQISNFSIIN